MAQFKTAKVSRKYLRMTVAMSILLAACFSTALAQYGGGSTNVCVMEARDKSGQPIGTGGKGFALRISGRDYLITTAHGMCELLGPSASPRTMFETIGTVNLRNFANQDLGNAGRCLLAGNLEARYDTDILVFELPYGTRMQSLYLAPALPQAGSKVWVLSKEGSNFSSDASIDRYPGTVTSSTIRALSVKLDSQLTAFHSSGSPVVDAKNQVVGMLCGTNADRSGIGCNPGLNIYQRLVAAGQVAAPRNQSTPNTRGQNTNSRGGVQTYR